LEIETVEKQAKKTKAAESQVAVAEVVVTKKGQTTIPVKLRRKYKIEEGTKLSVIDTKDGILFKRKKSFWDMLGAYSDPVKAEKIDKLLYEIRHEKDEDE
jgi:AbrB family looped-hinge helix DNA binding protein